MWKPRHREATQLGQSYRNSKKEESKQSPRAVTPSKWSPQAQLLLTREPKVSLGTTLAMFGYGPPPSAWVSAAGPPFCLRALSLPGIDECSRGQNLKHWPPMPACPTPSQGELGRNTHPVRLYWGERTVVGGLLSRASGVVSWELASFLLLRVGFSLLCCIRQPQMTVSFTGVLGC